MRTAYHQLRSSFPSKKQGSKAASTIESDRYYVQINPAYGYEVDVLQVEALLAVARSNRGTDWQLDDAYRSLLEQQSPFTSVHF